MSYRGKVIWITGASAGIGKALAHRFAREEAYLILSARRGDVLEEVADECRKLGAPDCLVHAFDMTDEPNMPTYAKTAFEWHNRLDMIINNAGISQRSLAIDTDMKTYRKLFEIDVFGQIALNQAVLPYMIKQNSGHMVVTASVAGKIGAPLRTGYCAAKHAVMGYFDALRTEVTRHNIKVSTITPGYIQTEIAHHALKGDGEANGAADPNIENGMPVDECAEVIFKGLSKGKPEIPVGNGPEMKMLLMKRFFPKLLFKLAALK